MGDPAILGLLALLLLVFFLLRQRRPSGKSRRKPARRHHRKPARHPHRKRLGETRTHAVIGGSNVMHWQDNLPQLEPVASALKVLERHGYHAGVIFDANAGHKLKGRFVNDAEFGRLLGVGRDRIMVVPKGTQADPFLLRYATEAGAIVISNDRFRDWLGDYPAIGQPGRLVSGEWREGKVWLNLPKR